MLNRYYLSHLRAQPTGIHSTYEGFLTFVHPDDRDLIQNTIANTIEISDELSEGFMNLFFLFHNKWRLGYQAENK